MDLCISCSCNPSLLHFSSNERPKRFNNNKRRGLIAKSELKTFEPNPTTPSSSSSRPAPTHRVTVHDRQRGVVHEFLVPEDQYILHTAESQNINLPFACRHGCCTTCAVRVKSGQIRQPEALGISAELKSKGYALLCVGFPSSDLEVETQDEDEVYWLQFGRYFARGPIPLVNMVHIFFFEDITSFGSTVLPVPCYLQERDDYALELAMGDE